MLTENDVRSIFIEAGVIRKGHFRLTSERHSNTYIDKRTLLMRPQVALCLCNALSERFLEDDIQVVIGPETGGIVPSFLIAHCLGLTTNEEILTVSASKIEGVRSAKSNFKIRHADRERLVDKRVLVVEDILTTGGSARQVVGLVGEVGGQVVGVGALCSRGEVTAERLGVPKLETLLQLNLKTYDVSTCPQCRQGVPLDVDFGH